MYTTGSLALADFVHGRSDIDIIIVAEDTAPVARRVALAARIEHRNLPCPAAGLELVVTAQSAAALASTDASFLLEVNTGVELPPLVILDPTGRPRFWYVIDRLIARQSGEALLGPPPTELISAVTRADSLTLLVESLDYQLEHLGREELAESVVLNACRSMRFAEEDRWFSKPAAGRWATQRNDLDADLVTVALETHRNGRGRATRFPLSRVRPFIVTARSIVDQSLEHG
jgi:hypothetical protein